MSISEAQRVTLPLNPGVSCVPNSHFAFLKAHVSSLPVCMPHIPIQPSAHNVISLQDDKPSAVAEIRPGVFFVKLLRPGSPLPTLHSWGDQILKLAVA